MKSSQNIIIANISILFPDSLVLYIYICECVRVFRVKFTDFYPNYLELPIILKNLHEKILFDLFFDGDKLNMVLPFIL